jgi:asparagine synthase (glutamine-hydrolysing)
MCGIAGVIGNESVFKVKKMLDAQHHRGPDNKSVWNNNNLTLGHNRLSIIDLTDLANQPFENEDYVLVFNGEIYNYLELKEELLSDYTFKTNSDTEVLLASFQQWGRKCLDKLNGMFSFAIWDKNKRQLFAARDRFGVKPFYYAFEENTFYFASEIKALFKAGVKKILNKKSWANYFMYGNYGMPNETFFENVYQLPASHHLTYNLSKITIHKWYFFENEVKKYLGKKETYEEAKENYKNLLRDSIRLRFRSDVPLGFNVSGGVDSSTLLALVNLEQNSNIIKAFTFYTGDDKYDELSWVKELIDITGNPLTEILFSADEVENFTNFISEKQDEPFGGVPTLAYAKLFKVAKEEGITVLLDGQGMDEQWAGYDYYTNNTKSTIQGVKSSPFKKQVFTDKLRSLAKKPNYPKPFNDDLLNLQYRDLFYTKIPRALRFNDRISMAFSTELREPFLDYRLVEYAFAQPTEYKIKDSVQKKMLRDIVAEHLNDSIVYAPKRPLQTPQREWLGNELRDFVAANIDYVLNSEYKSWFNKEKMMYQYLHK